MYILSSSPFVLDSRAKEIRLGRGFAQAYFILAASSQSVSPVVVSLSFATAAMEPGPAPWAVFCSLPAIVSNWLKRSFFSLFTL